MTKKEYVIKNFPEFSALDNFGCWNSIHVNSKDKNVFSVISGNYQCPRNFGFSDRGCVVSEDDIGDNFLCNLCWNEEAGV